MAASQVLGALLSAVGLGMLWSALRKLEQPETVQKVHMAALSVEAGHDIAAEARNRVLQRHRVLHLMTQVYPWRRPDLDHAMVHLQPANQGAP